MYIAEEILNAREKRVEFQKALQDKYKKPLMIIRANYPGLNKDNDLTRKIVKVICDSVSSIFQGFIIYKLLSWTAEGPIFIAIISDDAKKIKNMCIEIEDNHTMGRCVDIDVYDSHGTGLSRKELGHKPRTCFICDKSAHLCVRSKEHTQEEVIGYIRKKYNEYVDKIDEK